MTDDNHCLSSKRDGVIRQEKIGWLAYAEDMCWKGWTWQWYGGDFSEVRRNGMTYVYGFN